MGDANRLYDKDFIKGIGEIFSFQNLAFGNIVSKRSLVQHEYFKLVFYHHHFSFLRLGWPACIIPFSKNTKMILLASLRLTYDYDIYDIVETFVNHWEIVR